MPRKKPDAAGVPAASPESEIAKVRRARTKHVVDKAMATAAREEARKAKAAGKPKGVFETLDDLGLDYVLDMVEQGKFIAQIAREIAVSRRMLQHWIDQTDERRNAVKAARVEAAHAFALKAEEALDELQPESTQAEIAKAREKASHYRWMAKMLSPADYGDRQTIEVKTPASDLSDEQLEAEIAAKARLLGGLPVGTRLQ